MNITQIAALLKDLVHQAGRIILSAHKGRELCVESKMGSANFVTSYDTMVQEHVIRRIKEIIPDAVFIAEEKDNDPSAMMGEHCFIIDPIDGTTNFIHGFRASCISIAMASRGEVILAAIYDPYRDELFTAEKGKGAFLNDRPIHVSDRVGEQTVITFGTSPYYKDSVSDKTFALAKDVFLAMGDLRRLGSAALDLANLAAGRADAFFEMILSPWDFAAGMLIVREAGGIVTQIDGSEVKVTEPCSIFAGTPNTHSTLLALARKYC